MNEQALAVHTAFWDDWLQAALAVGVAYPLAALGAQVLRTHRQNRWNSEFFGAEDDAPHMLTLCLEDPVQAEMLFIENLYPYNKPFLEETRTRLGLK
jgi:hypothetical protein